MKVGTCGCALCKTRMRPSHTMTPRKERLRGFEFELDIQAIDGMQCAGHLLMCSGPAVWKKRHRPADDGDCDCEVCMKERPKDGQKYPCGGHPCVVDGVAPYLTNVVKGADSPYPVRGDFTQYTHTPKDNEFWELKTDRSCGFELASPPMAADEMKAVVAPVLDVIVEEERKHRTPYTSPRCGLHCTFDIQDLGLRGLKQILFTVAKHQAAMLATQPPDRKNNVFCAPLKDVGKLMRGLARTHSLAGVRMRDMDEEAPPTVAGVDPHVAQLIQARQPGRGPIINIAKWQKHGLVEFRFGGATTDWRAAEAYATMLECAIEAAIRRPAVYVPGGRYSRKTALFKEVMEPYIKDRRVEAAWEMMAPRLEEARLG